MNKRDRNATSEDNRSRELSKNRVILEPDHELPASSSKKKGKRHKKGSAILAASQGRSAVDAVKPSSRRDVEGTSGLNNTGPVVNYEGE
jgi:hypothetical protein